MGRRIYLDQAATSWPKLPAAIEAAEKYLHECGATSGRGAYSSARTAEQWVQSARHHLARLVGATDASDIAFCNSGTHALNAAIFGWIQPGDHVLTTAIEHNSVLRPLEQMRNRREVEVSLVPCDETGFVSIDEARARLQPNTRWMVVSSASNVTGRRQELALWSELANESGAQLIVDASQTLGYLPIQMQDLGISAIASAGHKGLGALPGTGFLAANAALRDRLQPLLFGGTGTDSEHLDAVPHWPHSVEVGNLNLPAVVSMSAAADHYLALPDDDWTSWQRPLQHLVKGLVERFAPEQVRLIGHQGSHEDAAWLPIVSLHIQNWDNHEAAAVLDSNFGIEVRAGFHCAAMVHRYLGSEATGGTLRLSLGHHTPLVDIDEALHAIGAIATAM